MKLTLNVIRPHIPVAVTMITITRSMSRRRSRVSQERNTSAPMCKGVESDTPGSCARCGMTLERNPAFLEPNKIIYTCPMHPQIRAGSPGKLPDMRHDPGAEDDRSGG